MRKLTLAFLALSISAVAIPAAAGAAPTAVKMRIEGRAETLFEGPVLTDGHDIQSLSDAEPRRCDGLNNGANPTPGPTPTAAGVDAMAVIGESFDASWYDGFDDYFLTQWGPDRQDDGAFEYWGLLVNGLFSNVGGCQLQVDGDDEVIWVYNAFGERPRLHLYPADYSDGAVPATATAALGEPFEVEVDAWEGYVEDTPPAQPPRSTTTFAGAQVAPVVTAANGFQRIDVASPETVTTGAGGKATIVFDEPGWHRIKGTQVSGGTETAIRSNRLDVCVPAPAASDCGAPPADTQVRSPTPPEDDGGGKEQPGGNDGGSGGDRRAETPPTTEAPAADPGRLGIALRALDRSRLGRGVVGVSWRITAPGAGVRNWTISSRKLGRKGARFVPRAKGKARTSAVVKLPPGASYKLRIAFTDKLGRSSGAVLGTVRVPKR